MKLFSLAKKYVPGLAVTVASLGAGFALGSAVENTRLPQATPSPVPVQTSQIQSIDVDAVGEAAILPQTDVKWVYTFEKCEHEHIKHGNEQVVGYTESDIACSFLGASVEKLTRDEAIISVRMDGYCPQHYLLRQTADNALCVLKTNEESFDCEQIMRLSTDVSQLDDAALEALSDGIVFGSLEEINSYLEDAES